MLQKSIILLFLSAAGLSVAAATPSVRNVYSPVNRRYQIFRYLLGYVDSRQQEKNKQENDITVLSWNVLAPIRVDVKNLTAAGTDGNLLKTDVRMYVIAKRILDFDADIVLIQEIQDDTYETLKNYLEDTYSAVEFASHSESHWPDIAPGATNVPNGIAIYYRKNKLVSQYVETFQTSESGNVAQAAVFKRRGKDGSVTSPPIMIVNVHFQHGFGIPDSNLRVLQGGAVHKKIEEITKTLRTVQRTKTPLVIVGGDFNSITRAPGIETFKARGYTDIRNATNNTDWSIYYPEVVITTFLPPLYGVPIDTMMVPTSLIDSAKLVINSFDVADVSDDEHTEDGYIMKVLGDVANDMRMGNINREISKAILKAVLNMMNDDNDYDTLFNRAMRIGADHVPVFASFCT